jgi:hypothetical protein
MAKRTKAALRRKPPPAIKAARTELIRRVHGVKACKRLWCATHQIGTRRWQDRLQNFRWRSPLQTRRSKSKARSHSDDKAKNRPASANKRRRLNVG